MLLMKLTGDHSSFPAIKIDDGVVDERRIARDMITVADHLADDRPNDSRTSEPSRTKCDIKPHQSLPLLLRHDYRGNECRANQIDTANGAIFSLTDIDLLDQWSRTPSMQQIRKEA